MTGLEAVTRTLERVDEDPASPAFYTAAEALAALNEAQRMFTLLTLCLEKTATITVSNHFTHLLTLAADFLLPLRLRVTGGAKVQPGRVQTFDAYDCDWPGFTGVPAFYSVLGFDMLVLDRVSPGTSLDLTYAYCPVTIAANSTPPAIPEEYHQSLIDYAVPRLRAKEGGQEFQESLWMFDRFLADAAKMANYVRARALSQRYERVPFEVEKFDRSKWIRAAMKQTKPAALDIPQAQEANGSQPSN